jgi:hypothetical protein
MKKRWAKKEAQIREEMRRKRDRELKSKDKASFPSLSLSLNFRR